MFWIIIIHKPCLCPRPSLLVHFQRLLLLFSHATYCVLNIQNPWSSTCLSSSVDTWKNSNTLLIYFTISVTKYSGKKKSKEKELILDHCSQVHYTMEGKSRTHDSKQLVISHPHSENENSCCCSVPFLYLCSMVSCVGNSSIHSGEKHFC